jgi:hypothetical protein
VFLAGRSLGEALNSVWTLLGTSFGLTISGLVTAVRHELPLYQAIILTDLLWLADYAIFVALAAYNRHPRNSYTVQYAAILQIYFSSLIVLYVWARAPLLESDEDAGKTVFVVLFVSTSAIAAGRIIALVFTSLLIAGYSFIALPYIWQNPPELKKLIDGFVDARDPLPIGQPPHPPMQSTAPTCAAPAGHNSTTTSLPNPPPSHRLRRVIDPHLVTLSLYFGIPYIITLICTELQIHRNRLCTQNSSLEFGQVRLFSFSARNSNAENRFWL